MNEFTNKLCANKWLMLNCYCYIAILETILLSAEKNELRLILKCYQKNVFTNPIYLINTYKEDLALNNLQWLIYHKIQDI